MNLKRKTYMQIKEYTETKEKFQQRRKYVITIHLGWVVSKVRLNVDEKLLSLKLQLQLCSLFEILIKFFSVSLIIKSLIFITSQVSQSRGTQGIDVLESDRYSYP